MCTHRLHTFFIHQIRIFVTRRSIRQGRGNTLIGRRITHIQGAGIAVFTSSRPRELHVYFRGLLKPCHLARSRNIRRHQAFQIGNRKRQFIQGTIHQSSYVRALHRTQCAAFGRRGVRDLKHRWVGNVNEIPPQYLYGLGIKTLGRRRRTSQTEIHQVSRIPHQWPAFCARGACAAGSGAA